MEDKDAYVLPDCRPASSLSSAGYPSTATSSFRPATSTTTDHATAVFSLGNGSGALEIAPFETEVCDRLILAVETTASLGPVLRQAKETVQRHAKWFTQAGIACLMQSILKRATESYSTADLSAALDFIDAVGTFAAIPFECLLPLTQFVAYAYHQSTRMNKHSSLADKTWTVLQHGVQSHLGPGCIVALQSVLQYEEAVNSKKDFATTSGVLRLVGERLALGEVNGTDPPTISVFQLLSVLQKAVNLGDDIINEQVWSILRRVLAEAPAIVEVNKSASWGTCIDVIEHANNIDDKDLAYAVIDVLSQHSDQLNSSDTRRLAHLSAASHGSLSAAMISELLKQFTDALNEGLKELHTPEDLFLMFQYENGPFQELLVNIVVEKLGERTHTGQLSALHSFVRRFADKIVDEHTSSAAAESMTAALSAVTYTVFALPEGDDSPRKIDMLTGAMSHIATTARTSTAQLRALRILARIRTAIDGAVYLVGDETAEPALTAATTPGSIKAVDIPLQSWLMYVLSLMDTNTADADPHCVGFVLSSFSDQLSNHALFYNRTDVIKRCFDLVCGRLNAGRPDHVASYVKILTTLISYRADLSQTEHRQLISAFLKTAGSSEIVSTACIHALTICCYEMPDTASLFMDDILQKMHRMVTQRHLAIHVLEFLSGLSRLEALYKHSFRFDDFKRIFGVSFSYLDSLRNNGPDKKPPLSDQASSSDNEVTQSLSQYVHALAYHVIVFWYLATRPEHRGAIKEYASSRLKYTNLAGEEVLEDQALVTIDLMDSVDAEIASDSAAHDSLAADDTERIGFGQKREDQLVPALVFNDQDGKLYVRHRVFGLLVITTHTSIRTGATLITTRRPSGTFRSLYTAFKTRLHDSKIETTLHSQQGWDGEDLVHPIFAGDDNGRLYGSITVPSSASPLGSGDTIELPQEEAVDRAISTFDRTPGLDSHKAGVIYIGEGQTTEQQVFLNASGSPDYREFVRTLGTLRSLQDATFNTQGLDTQTGSDGPAAIVWNSEVTELVYHITTMMPTLQTDDPSAAVAKKKRHTGNDHVNIVFNNSGAPFNFHMFPSAFNYVYIVITPSVRTTFMQARMHTMATPVQQRFYNVEVLTADGFPAISSAAERKIVSGSSLPGFVRNLALNACIFAEVWAHREDPEHRSSWRLRLEQIRQLRARYGMKSGWASVETRGIDESSGKGKDTMRGKGKGKGFLASIGFGTKS